jgi:hypothetical protein
MHSAFQYNQYLVKRQLFALTGKIRVYQPNGSLVLYCQQKIFRLKEDIRVYSDENRNQELLYIQARQIVDFSANYDVFDSTTNEAIGMLRRKGFRSLARDHWQLFNNKAEQIAIVQEDNLTKAFLRRVFLGNLLPLSYDMIIDNVTVATFKQRFNILQYELDLDFVPNRQKSVDHRLGIAACLLLAIIEGRQN